MASAGKVTVTCPLCSADIPVPITLTAAAAVPGRRTAQVTVKAAPVRHRCRR